MPADDLIDGYMASLRERSCTQRSINTYRYQLGQSDRHLPYGLDSSTEEEIRAWIWRDGLGPASRALTHSALTGFFTWAVKAQYLDFNPMIEIPHPKVPLGLPRGVTDEDAAQLVAESRQPFQLWAELAAYAGMRCIEVDRVRREHITEEEVRIFGKGNKYRIVPTHSALWKAVRDLPAGELTHELDERRISTRFQRYCVEVHGLKASLHRLRVWFATQAYKQTKDVLAVQRLLGHANLATTARYLGLDNESLRTAVNAVPTLVAGCAGGTGRRERLQPR